MADRQRKHITYLTVDEMSALSVLAEMFIKTEGKLGRLAELPISDQYRADLTSANEKLSKKIEEVGE